MLRIGKYSVSLITKEAYSSKIPRTPIQRIQRKRITTELFHYEKFVSGCSRNVRKFQRHRPRFYREERLLSVICISPGTRYSKLKQPVCRFISNTFSRSTTRRNTLRWPVSRDARYVLWRIKNGTCMFDVTIHGIPPNRLQSTLVHTRSLVSLHPASFFDRSTPPTNSNRKETETLLFLGN